MPTLYELTDDMLQLMEMLEEGPESDLTKVLKDTLEGVQGEREIKAENYCKVIKEYESEMDNIKKEIDRLSQRKERSKNNIKRMKTALKNTMYMTNTTRIKGDLFTLSLRNTPEFLDHVPNHLPQKYLIEQDAKVDRRLLLEDIKNGIKVEGVTTKRDKILSIR